jgi:hypothetical protein
MHNNNVLKGYRKKEHLIGKDMFSEGSTILEVKTNKCGRVITDAHTEIASVMSKSFFEKRNLSML